MVEWLIRNEQHRIVVAPHPEGFAPAGNDVDAHVELEPTAAAAMHAAVVVVCAAKAVQDRKNRLKDQHGLIDVALHKPRCRRGAADYCIDVLGTPEHVYVPARILHSILKNPPARCCTTD